jgi:hypothetical protein
MQFEFKVPPAPLPDDFFDGGGDADGNAASSSRDAQQQQQQQQQPLDMEHVLEQARDVRDARACCARCDADRLRRSKC